MGQWLLFFGGHLVVNFVIIKGWFLNGLLNFDISVFLIGFINGIMGGEFIDIGGGFVGGVWLGLWWCIMW
jgi:hypothetical protein